MTDIPVVVSNHEDAREVVESFSISFKHIPATKDIRQQAEAKQLQVFKDVLEHVHMKVNIDEV